MNRIHYLRLTGCSDTVLAGPAAALAAFSTTPAAASGSPGGLRALRHAQHLARDFDAILVPAHPVLRRLRTLARASSAVSSASGSVWRYFSVVRRLPWPRRSLTTWRSAPPESSQDACACLRS